MIVSCGEVLFDIFPDSSRLGGAPFNFSCHLARLGHTVRFLSRVGEDDNGQKIMTCIRQYGLNTYDVQIDPVRPTGYVSVSLDATGVPDFEIVPDVAYDHLEFSDHMRRLMRLPPALFYFGTLVQRAPASRQTLQRLFDQKDEKTTFFYDVNLRRDCYTWEIIENSLRYTDILKLNEEELDTIKEMTGFQKNETDFIAYLLEEYRLSLIALTRGNAGSALYAPEAAHETAAVVPDTPVDTVGAGDAFAAVLAAGYLRGLPLPQTLEAASAFAADVCTIAGAVPEDDSFYDKTKRFLG
ncbi:MAG: carbohydrate kinase family protein [Desulfosudaceae bacterium]